jgi:hypothetical protein
VIRLRAVVLVEGNSDRVALHAVAEGSSRDLAADGIEVVAMGGITNTRAFAPRYGPNGLGLRLAGLYDAADEAKLRHGLVAAGLGAALEPDGLLGLGPPMGPSAGWRSPWSGDSGSQRGRQVRGWAETAARLAGSRRSA